MVPRFLTFNVFMSCRIDRPMCQISLRKLEYLKPKSSARRAPKIWDVERVINKTLHAKFHGNVHVIVIVYVDPYRILYRYPTTSIFSIYRNILLTQLTLPGFEQRHFHVYRLAVLVFQQASIRCRKGLRFG